MLDLSIRPLQPGSPWPAQIAAEQFEYWGPLTGHASRASYETFLEQAAHSRALPRVLVATSRTTLLGSVNLLASEMTVRPQLTPWLSQLFVTASRRKSGAGSGLLDAAVSCIAELGYRQLFLFTSGTLPAYYRSRGWRDVEDVDYLGKLRTVMRFAIDP